MLNRTLDFLRDHIWRIRFDDLDRRQRLLLRPLRVMLLALRGFQEHRVRLRASALALYSLLSIVPVLAVAFGVAKGFGLQERLEVELRDTLRGQEEILDPIIRFSQTILAEARGGIIAGVGVIVLFWTVIRLLTNIEQSFNEIWGVRQGRRFGRRVFDYLSIVLVAPILIIMAGAMTAGITGVFAEGPSFLNLDLITSWVRGLMPFLLVVAVLMAMYLFIPHIRVSFGAALLGGVVAGTLYQLVQWGYFESQIAVSGYNKVYGTFAALPLFLVWLQISWVVILFGAEVAFAVDNESTYAHEHDCDEISPRLRKLLSLKFTKIACQRFKSGEGPVTASELSHRLDIPIRLVRDILFGLTEAKVLAEVSTGERSTEAFQPARAIGSLTTRAVLRALDRTGTDDRLPLDHAKLTQLADVLDETNASTTERAEKPLHELPD